MGKTSKQSMVGKKYGILEVISEIKERNKNGHILYNVKCECGKEKKVLGASLRAGTSRSCNRCHILTGSHGMCKSKEYKAWQSIKDRCLNVNNTNYKNYGGRGILVCDLWKNSFENFYRDMGGSKGLTIDRIDVNGNYEKNNCRWVDEKIQARNRRNNLNFTYKEETICMSELCSKINMPISTFFNRIKRGWSIEKCIETPINIKYRNK